MKKGIVLLLAALLVLSLAACAQQTNENGTAAGNPGTKTENPETAEKNHETMTENPETAEENPGFVQIPNPWVDCATLDEAAGLAGFEIAVPGKFDGYPNKAIQAMEKSMIQVLYFDGDPEAETSSMVMVRKGTGSEDVSGDYNEYSEKETVQLHGVDVQLRGEKGLVYSAIWTWNGYSFAINADKGLSRDAISDAIGEMVTTVG